MMFQALASSSHGNAYLVSDGFTSILLECGLSHRRLKKAAGFSLSEVSACFVSHEHRDHAACCLDLLKDGVEVFASAGTAAALGCGEISIVEDMEPVTVGTLEVMPFRTFHDAAEPFGYLVRSGADGDKLAFATDTVNLQYRFPGVTLLALECNYAAPILERCERMPEKVRRRIRNSHMEVSRLCRYLAGLDLSSCRELYLLHLSDACSNQLDFVRKVKNCVPEGVSVSACPALCPALC